MNSHMCSANSCLFENCFKAERIIKYIKTGSISDSLSQAVNNDQLEHEKEMCSICLETIETNFAYLDACSHGFCRACIDQWRVERTTCPLCRSPSLLTIYTTIRATREEVSYLAEQHFLCPFIQPPERQIKYSPRVIEHFLNIMRCNVPIDQMFAPDKLLDAVQQIYDYVFTRRT
ncbi:hypothetical protein HELRODRAFT_164455 [Helobdella robusta]|uniref:RING-type E3 ubiquitin transferase n=1 Tax=Helobdella robusta TaxID=6412 RepID=T1EVF7_HELRO|nr:hypothetical protein HELRODRAFT_164455 [Helobdella robusta]ESN94590.1 hypothetical protein HELRODRAFT_164455 [Helobdella robusta]